MQFSLSKCIKKWNDLHCSDLKVYLFHSTAISAISSCTSESSSSNEDQPREACLMLTTREQASYIGRREEVKGAGGNRHNPLCR